MESHSSSSDQVSEGAEIKIIIVTGLPACDKTRLAMAVAKWLQCPILCMESIIKGSLPPTSESTLIIPTSPKTKNLINVAIRILFQQAAMQIHTAVKHHPSCIVLEFPLSSPSQLQYLIEQVRRDYGARIDKIVIVKCKPQNKTRWRMHFEKGVPEYSPLNPYRMNNWNDVLSAIKHTTSLDIFGQDGEKCDNVYVSELEMDPLIDYFLFPDYATLNSNTLPPLYLALHYMLFTRDNKKEGGGCFLTMRKWGEFKYKHIERKFGICSEGKGSSYHEITNEMPSHGGHWSKPKCGVCEKRVLSSSGYFCRSCPLALHKECAELKERYHMSFQPFTVIESLSERTCKYEIQKMYGCKFCKKKGKDFSEGCYPCLFETHLRCNLWPTIVVHPLHPHILQTQIIPELDFNFQVCAACGTYIRKGVVYFCNFCSLTFGFSCATQHPMEVIHKHVGYEHPMKLRPSATCEGLDNYICHVCWEERDPEVWHYYCEDCDFSAHVQCMGDHCLSMYH